jgi:hypothetical protein
MYYSALGEPAVDDNPVVFYLHYLSSMVRGVI